MVRHKDSTLLYSLFSLISAGCAVVHPWEAIVIGAIGAFVATFTADLLDKFKIDDPVGAISVHGACGIWVRFTPFAF